MIAGKHIDILKHIAEFEDSHDPERDYPMGWCWRQVRVWGSTLNKLCLEGYLDTTFKSNNYTGYRLTEMGRALALPDNDESVTSEPPLERPLTLPENLFEDIVGHDEVKELLRAAILADKPVHVLLAGPPALANTLFLWDLERIAGDTALWLVGSAASKAGLWDLVVKRQPQWLLVDEIDKMPAADTAGLLSLMEGGRVTRAKVGRRLDQTVTLRVVAATNNLNKLSPELRSRFAIRRLEPYSGEEFLTVVE